MGPKSHCKLTIVTVTYKDPAGLRLTLESLRPLFGTSLSWELIVVDSSSDVNRDVMASFLPRTEIRHLTRPPRGIYEALNSGWREAKGEFLWFLNGGDTLKDEPVLFSALELLERDPELAWVQAGLELRRDGKPLYTKAARPGLRPLLGINRVCQQALVYRAAKLSELGGFKEEYRLAADYEFHLRALALGAKDGTVPGALVSYDMSGQSTRFREALAEFSRVQSDLLKQGLLPQAAAHSTLRALEHGKLLLLECLRGSRGGRAALRAWYAVRRAGGPQG